MLPLENLSGDPAQEYFADGMTDELITDLAKIGGLRVISRTSVMKFKGEHREQLPEIAKALNVDTIVEGSVLRVGDKVRITAQLIDAPNDKHLWAESYERDTRDVLSMQDELASTIARQIDVELTPAEQARFAKPRPVNPQALEAILKGNYFLRKQTSDGFQKAKEYYEQAIKIAPDYAEGYVGLAAMYVVAADFVLSNREAMPKAKELLETALRLDDTNAPAHSLLGTIYFSYAYDWVAAESENRRAIELAPGNAFAHSWYAFMLVWQARFDEAERELKLAQLIDPLSPYHYVAMGQLLNVRKDYPKALEQCRKALEVDPASWAAYSTCLGFSYEGMGNHGEALKEFEKGVAIEPGPQPIAFLGLEYARSGNREQARKAIEQLNHLPAQTYVSPCWPASVYVALGENNTALDLLEKAYQERSGCVATLKVLNYWNPLRSDPRFIALLKNVGLDK
ncbi:MAG TPA: tetratricopeptide repeat protein [Candidatus Binataceae bacterium]